MADPKYLAALWEFDHQWKQMKENLATQLNAFNPPMNLRTSKNGKDTTGETKERLRRCLNEIDTLISDTFVT